MSDPLQLALILHLHRPPGLDRRARLAAWDDCFQPLIGALHHNPDLRVGLVLAGELVEDLKESHGDGIEWIGNLVSRDQVELVGTPMHEPVLGSVPERDGTDQILTHATLIKKIFGIRPSGCWLPLGIWDPSLPRVIAKASMHWCPVEDRFLVDVGAGGRDGVYGAWRTEREGYAIGLLPVDTGVRDLAGNVPVKDVFLHLRRCKERGQSHITLAFSAARFGLRPGKDSQADQTWLATFLAGLAGATGQVRTIRPSDAAAGFPQMGQVYLPTSAPAHIGVPWERNLSHYDEANRVHKKMLKVSREVHRLDREVKEGAHSALRPDPTLLVQARRYLYRGQHPAAYWHGEEAGIYDPVLRARTWRDLLRAEKVVSTALRRENRMSVETVDLDCDGIKEVVFRTPHLSAVVDPARGAAVTELSWYGPDRNLVNTMTRMPEPYHAVFAEGDLPDLESSETTDTEWEDDEVPTALTRIPVELLAQAEAGLERAIGRDSRPRVSFIERMIGPEVTLSDIQRGTLHEVGRGAQDAVWELVTTERRGDEVLRAMFSTDVTLAGEDEARVRLHKRYTVRRDPVIEVRVEAANRTHQAVRTRLTMELNLTLGPDASQQSLVIDGRTISLSEVGEIPEVDRLHLECSPHRATLEVHRPARLWHYPIRTFHRHRGHRVSAIQGVCLVLQWAVELWGRERDVVALNLELLEAR